MQEDLLDTLKDIVSLTKVVPNVNDGGCGVFAYYLAKHLEERYIDYSVVTAVDYIDEDISYQLKNCEFCDNLIPNHVFLNIGDYYIDPEQISTDLEEMKIFEDSTVIKIDEVASDGLKFLILSSGWNPEFNRKENENKIETIINLNFIKYDQNRTRY